MSIKRHFTMTLSPEQAAYIEQTMAEQDIQSAAECVRYLIEVQKAANPQLGAVRAVQLRAFNEVRIWTLTQVNQMFAALRETLEVGLRETPADQG